MKLFHTEKGKEVVYVQMQDMVYLYESSIAIPATIFNKVFKPGTTIITNDSNRFDFIKFEKDDEVKFFRDLEFIIDYDQYKDFTDEQFEEEELKLITKANEIGEKLNSMIVEMGMEDEVLCYEYQKIEYMLKFLYEVYDVKHGQRSMPFPYFVKEEK